MIELERSGIRDGDGYWHGADVIGGTAHDLIKLCKRLMETHDAEMPKPETRVAANEYVVTEDGNTVSTNGEGIYWSNPPKGDGWKEVHHFNNDDGWPCTLWHRSRDKTDTSQKIAEDFPVF